MCMYHSPGAMRKVNSCVSFASENPMLSSNQHRSGSPDSFRMASRRHRFHVALIPTARIQCSGKIQ
jgi:hypothetical protein